MKNNYLYYLAIYFVTGFFMLASMIVRADNVNLLGDSTKAGKIKITDTRSNKPAYLKNGVKVNFIPFKPAVDNVFGNTSNFPVSVVKNEISNIDTDKILANVKVYPNPVSDQLNLSYRITKEATISIKIMDVLGNEILTLFTERISAGEQTNSFNIASKLNSGFYFVRVIAGSESVVKRISVL